MNFGELLGDSFIVTGEVVIAYMVIAVHIRLRQEHHLDKRVWSVIRREEVIGTIGILLLIVGFAIRTYARYMA